MPDEAYQLVPVDHDPFADVSGVGVVPQDLSGQQYVSQALRTIRGAGDYLGIPQGNVLNAQGQVVFPTNALERSLQSSDQSSQQYAAAFMGPGKEPTPYQRSLAMRLAQAREYAAKNAGDALHNYDVRSQTEWLGQSPPQNGKLTLYRATPDGSEIKPGDYVTNSREYAQRHIDNNLGGEGKITSVEAHLRDIHPADGPKEFWYYPQE